VMQHFCGAFSVSGDTPQVISYCGWVFLFVSINKLFLHKRALQSEPINNNKSHRLMWAGAVVA
jgi:hypothetical protein